MMPTSKKNKRRDESSDDERRPPLQPPKPNVTSKRTRPSTGLASSSKPSPASTSTAKHVSTSTSASTSAAKPKPDPKSRSTSKNAAALKKSEDDLLDIEAFLAEAVEKATPATTQLCRDLLPFVKHKLVNVKRDTRFTLDDHGRVQRLPGTYGTVCKGFLVALEPADGLPAWASQRMDIGLLAFLHFAPAAVREAFQLGPTNLDGFVDLVANISLLPEARAKAKRLAENQIQGVYLRWTPKFAPYCGKLVFIAKRMTEHDNPRSATNQLIAAAYEDVHPSLWDARIVVGILQSEMKVPDSILLLWETFVIACVGTVDQENAVQRRLEDRVDGANRIIAPLHVAVKPADKQTFHSQALRVLENIYKTAEAARSSEPSLDGGDHLASDANHDNNVGDGEIGGDDQSSELEADGRRRAAKTKIRSTLPPLEVYEQWYRLVDPITQGQFRTPHVIQYLFGDETLDLDNDPEASARRASLRKAKNTFPIPRDSVRDHHDFLADAVPTWPHRLEIHAKAQTKDTEGLGQAFTDILAHFSQSNGFL